MSKVVSQDGRRVEHRRPIGEAVWHGMTVGIIGKRGTHNSRIILDGERESFRVPNAELSHVMMYNSPEYIEQRIERMSSETTQPKPTSGEAEETSAGREARSIVKQLHRVGNSNALILDRPIMDLIGLEENGQVQLVVSEGSLILTPVHPRAVSKERFEQCLDRVVSQRAEVLRRLAK